MCLCGGLKLLLEFPSFFVQPAPLRFQTGQKWTTQWLERSWGDAVQVRFGDCALDTERRELRRGGTLISVVPQWLDILIRLLEDHEQDVNLDNFVHSY